MELQNSSISNFKRFLFKIALPFLLLISILGYTFSYFFEKKIIFANSICGAYKINRIVNETHTDEIPIFGSSRALNSFIPDSLGNNYFNYGLNNTKYDVTLFFLDEECKKKKHNPFIILNFDYSGLLRGYGDICNYIPFSSNDNIKGILGKDYQTIFEIPFLKYFGEYSTYTKYYFSDKLQLTKNTNKGAIIETVSLSEDKFNEAVEKRIHSLNNFYIDTSIQNKLFNVIQKNPDKYFVFVVTPYHNSYFINFTNFNDVNEFLKQLNSYKNVKVLDFSKLPLSNDMFFNTTHINIKGAKVFNKILKDSLNSLYINHCNNK